LPQSQHHANTALGSATAADLVAFAHAALFSPALSTLEEALHHGHVPEFAGLSLQLLQKHPPLSDATIKGHLDQMCQNLHSTKSHAPLDLTPDLPDADAFPPAIENGERTHFGYAAMMEPTGQTYMDLTGKFVSPSSSGNNYILIVYDYDSNGIHAVPLPNCCSESILTAYQTSHTRLCMAGLCPHLQHLDNEASQVLKRLLSG